MWPCLTALFSIRTMGRDSGQILQTLLMKASEVAEMVAQCGF